MILASVVAMIVLSWVLGITWLLRQLIRYKRAIRSTNDFPGYRGLGPNELILGFLLPELLVEVFHHIYFWNNKHAAHRQFGWDVVSNISWRIPRPIFHVADASVASQISSARQVFIKSRAMYSSLDLYGPNVVTAEGSDWARHRKISSPAFSDSLIQLAWEQTYRVVHEMFDDWAQRQGDIVTLNEAEEPMKLLALLVLMGAAFGHAEEWTLEAAPPEGHSMLFRDSVQILLKYFSIWDALPSWVWGSAKTRAALCVGGIGGAGLLGETLKRTGTAYMELGRYLREMLHERELVGNIEIKRDMRDVFTNLIVAMSAEDENARMSVDAVFGNMFVFVLAGHETTAHSLSFALALLALEPDEQDKLYEHTRQVLGDREPSLEDHSKLSRVLAVLYEAIRLFPAVTFMPKENVEDVSFLVNSALSEADMADPAAMERKDCQKCVFIPKGSSIKINVAGLHYNPRYWSDPYAFNPDRFLKSDWPKDAFLGFSAGPRGCLGRKFAEVEAVLALTLIVRQFRITTDTKKFKELPGESKLDRRNRLMNADVRITLTPEGIPLVLTRR